MLYSDGHEAKLGDRLKIGALGQGVVVACFDRAEYSKSYPKEEWEYLAEGVLVETSFAGLIHYQEFGADDLSLVAIVGES